jgi:hypothetical protein
MAVIPGILASSVSGHLITGKFYQIQQLSPSAVSTVTFSSIPSTYKSLQVRFNLVTSTNSAFRFQFNGDSGANYDQHTLNGSGSAASATAGVASTSSIQIFGFINNTSTTYPSVGVIDIVDYANTNKNKTVKSLVGTNNNTSTGSIEIDSGTWFSTAAITSITFPVISGTFTGQITLYGVN